MFALVILASPARQLAVSAQEVEPPHWAGDMVFTAGNSVLGGLAAGLVRFLDGGSFWDAFLGGALGGAVAYGGRRVAALDLAGSGLLGRELGAVGGSFVRNAAAGRGLVDELALPVWIARVYVERQPGDGTLRWRARVRLDAPTLLVVAYLSIRSDADLAAAASVSAGAPVFYTRERDADGWQGYQAAGVIWLKGDPWDLWPDAPEAAALAHERVHVLQYDFSQLSWGESLDGLLSGRLPHGEWIAAHLDLGLHVGAWGLANVLLPYRLRPWEHEAHVLSRAWPHPQ